jgi:hypothetical protein
VIVSVAILYCLDSARWPALPSAVTGNSSTFCLGAAPVGLSRARQTVKEMRLEAKDPVPLKVKEVCLKIVAISFVLMKKSARRDVHDREAIVAHLKEQLRQADKSLVVNKVTVAI